MRTFIEREQPGLVLCGHIHESRALDQFDGTTIANPGPTAAGHYAIVETGDHLTVEFDA